MSNPESKPLPPRISPAELKAIKQRLLNVDLAELEIRVMALMKEVKHERAG